MKLKTLADLKKHDKATGGSFFSAGNTRHFGSSRVWGVYRAPYSPDSEGYIITEAIFTGSDGVAAPAEFPVYRFEAAPDGVDWHSIGRHESLAAAEEFLAGMGVTK